jgi:hypothetical protein
MYHRQLRFYTYVYCNSGCSATGLTFDPLAASTNHKDRVRYFFRWGVRYRRFDFRQYRTDLYVVIGVTFVLFVLTLQLRLGIVTNAVAPQTGPDANGSSTADFTYYVYCNSGCDYGALD